MIQTGWGQNGYVDSLRIEFDKLYGSDVILNNGKKYFPESTSAKGHPFWVGQEPFLADVTVLGKIFQNQKLKYNICTQKFLLIYSDLNGENYPVILNTPFLDSVRTEGVTFIHNSYQEIDQPFVQLIYKGKISCVASIKKDLDFNNIGVNTGYGYSREIREYYLIINDLAYQFNNKWSFLKNFSAAKRSVVRNQISIDKVKFKRIDDNKLKQLVEFCDHTLE